MPESRFQRTVIRCFTTSCICFFLFSQTGMAQVRSGGKPTQSQPLVVSPPGNTSGTTGSTSGPATSFTDHFTGMTFEPVGSPRPGLLVKKVEEFSLGSRNGLERGDIILTFNGRAVSSQFDLLTSIQNLSSQNSTSQIPVLVWNVRTGQQIPLDFQRTTNAGRYTTSFGELELHEGPGKNAQEVNWNGTLRHGANAYPIKGTFDGLSLRFSGSLELGFGQQMNVSLHLIAQKGNGQTQGQTQVFLGDINGNQFFMIGQKF